MTYGLGDDMEYLQKENDKLRTSETAWKVVAENAVEERNALFLQNQELQNENAKLKRNVKCAGCGHSKENHDSSGCLVWVEADSERKCLCKVWTDIEKLNHESALGPEMTPMERILMEAVNEFCTCGGAGPEKGCVVCKIWHRHVAKSRKV